MKLKSSTLFVALLVASAVVTWLFWRGITFSGRLDDEDLIAALSPEASVREAEHGLEEATRRFSEGAAGADRWAALVIATSRRPEAVVRRVAAWSMQYGRGRADFAARLREMAASDSDLTTRRNAACALAASGDATGRPVLRGMLAPLTVTAPVAGTVDAVLPAGRRAEQDGFVARIATADGRTAEAPAQAPGRVEEVKAAKGAAVAAGDVLAVLSPDSVHAFNAAGALALVGTEEDVPLLETAASLHSAAGPQVAAQARAAIEAIRKRTQRR